MKDKKAEGTMTSTGMSRTLSFLAVAGVILGTQCTLAQNAAQKAALAKLNHTQAIAHPLGSSGVVEASNTSLNLPGGLAFDAAGDIFIADTGNNLIRKIDLAGLVTTVAGTGEQGFSGDGAAATNALLDSPTGIAVDATGNIYIADTNNNRIREVSSGTITTIAGTGVAGFGGDGAAANAAMLSQPTAVAVDSNGNIYFADTNNNRIREITGTTINTVAGNGEQTFSGDGGAATAAGLDSPSGVAVDAAFNIYIGDTQNQRVRMVAHATGIITTLAGTGSKGFTADGAALSAAFAQPRGVAVDSNGTVYVADSDNQRIRAIAGGQVTTIAGSGQQGFSGDTGSATGAQLDEPRTVAVFGTSVLVADTENDVVRTVTNGGVNTIGGTPTSGSESLTIGGSTTTLYGAGSVTANFSNGSNTATGSVIFYDGLGTNPALVASVLLSANHAMLSTTQLSAGTHYLVASYPGDANNAAITSGAYVLVVTPVQLTAVANSVNLLYGQAIPALSGTLSGVLTQDANNVTASYSTAATIISTPASYPISVALGGTSAGNYTAVLGATSGSVVIAQAPVTIGLGSSILTPILGTSFTLTATVTSTTSGTPTGTVNFYDETTLLNTAPIPLSSGVATLAVTTLPVGSQNITAVYSGSTNFLPNTSSALPVTGLAPEFTIAGTPSTQSVNPGESVNYTFTLMPTNSTFLYPVNLSASGLPAGVTATLTPSTVAAGAGTTYVTLTLNASTQARLGNNKRPLNTIATTTALALLMLPLVFNRRARRTTRQLSRMSKTLLALLAVAALNTLIGCGGASSLNHAPQSSTVTVTAVSGSVTHTSNVAVTVQ